MKKICDGSDDYCNKYMKIRFNSDDDLPFRKTLNMYNAVLLIRSVFNNNKNKFYLQYFKKNICVS